MSNLYSSSTEPEVIKNKCIHLLHQNKNNGSNIPLAVVFDIDETLIDLQGKLISPIADIYHYARDLEYIITIITSRPGTPNGIKYTQTQLAQLGLTGYHYLFLLPEGKTDPYRFKQIARQSLHEAGYKVLFSIGDKPWDIGHYGGIGFLIHTNNK